MKKYFVLLVGVLFVFTAQAQVPPDAGTLMRQLDKEQLEKNVSQKQKTFTESLPEPMRPAKVFTVMKICLKLGKRVFQPCTRFKVCL